MMCDYYEGKCDCMQIVSGDTDLTTPIKFAKERGIKINIVLPPYRKAKELIALADKKSNIKVKHLQKRIFGTKLHAKAGQDTAMPI